jgi:hypothetical protein
MWTMKQPASILSEIEIEQDLCIASLSYQISSILLISKAFMQKPLALSD